MISWLPLPSLYSSPHPLACCPQNPVSPSLVPTLGLQSCIIHSFSHLHTPHLPPSPPPPAPAAPFAWLTALQLQVFPLASLSFTLPVWGTCPFYMLCYKSYGTLPHAPPCKCLLDGLVCLWIEFLEGRCRILTATGSQPLAQCLAKNRYRHSVIVKAAID